MTRDPHSSTHDPSADAQRARADEVILRLVSLLARQVVRGELAGSVSTQQPESDHVQTDEA